MPGSAGESQLPEGSGPANVVSVREQQLQRDEEKAEPEIRGDDGERPEPAEPLHPREDEALRGQHGEPEPERRPDGRLRREDAQRPEQGRLRGGHGLDDRRLVAGDVPQLRERQPLLLGVTPRPTACA